MTVFREGRSAVAVYFVVHGLLPLWSGLVSAVMVEAGLADALMALDGAEGDLEAACSFLASHPELDPEAVALWCDLRGGD